MRPSTPPLTADPEFRPRTHQGELLEVPDPGAYRRILANPFPGFLALITWLWVLHHVLTDPMHDDQLGPLLIALLLPCGYLVVLLFRFQCLDCGATGPLHRWKRHLCPPVARRILAGRSRPMRGPSPALQVLFWLYVLGMALLAAQGFLSDRTP